MSSGPLSLRVNSGSPFSSTAPLGEVRYEVPAPNVGPTAGKPVESPWRRSRGLGGRGSSRGRDPLNLFLIYLVALGAHQGGHLLVAECRGFSGVLGTIEDPKLELFSANDGAGAPPFVTNNDWDDDAAIASASDASGGFALEAGSTDAGILIWLEPGNYTAKMSCDDGGTGVGLVEVYEVRNPFEHPRGHSLQSRMPMRDSRFDPLEHFRACQSSLGPVKPILIRRTQRIGRA